MARQDDEIAAIGHPIVYQIRIKCHLSQGWAGWFGGMTILLLDDEETLLTGPVADQAALHGLLRKVRDLGMSLVAVNQVGSEGPEHKLQVVQKGVYVCGRTTAGPLAGD
jgi:hypothetical protein